MDVTGRTAVVTGAAGGIGAALAAELLERGASVLITDLDADRLNGMRDELAERFGSDVVAAQEGDAADEATIRGWIETAEAQLGAVRIYAANAGIGGGGGLEATEEDWERGLQVNVMAHVRAARVLVPRWLEAGEGHFAVSKHGALAFAEWLAVTYGAQGIGVSCLCPMGVDTALLRADVGNGVARAAQAAVIEAGDVLSPAYVARLTVDAVKRGEFLVLPHPEVHEFAQRRAADHGRWIVGMQRFSESLSATTPVTGTVPQNAAIPNTTKGQS